MSYPVPVTGLVLIKVKFDFVCHSHTCDASHVHIVFIPK